ncbi:fibronectin type III domain protein, partial [Lacinutrix venerupis]|uniref:choice-of-anchor L domain-containing protein n=1 Tax=Lacinutrix venerupis TaxID=1486034 RepID=UPI000EB54116
MKKITLLLILLLISLSINAQTYLTENFDTEIPASWTIDDGGDATGDSWISGQQGFANNSLDGTNAAIVDSDANGNGTLLFETLTSPTFDTTGATAIFLDFTQYFNNGSTDTATVEVWDGSAWVAVLTQSADAGTFATPDEQHIDLTAYSNSAMQVRFVYDDNNIWAWYWLIDNVIIYNATCPNPDNLTLINTTATEANFSWTAGGTETAWEVAVQPQGTGFPTGSGTATSTNNPYLASGLTPATNYEAFVRADCGGGDYSIWIGPINFTTECTTFIAPYTEGFDNGGAIPLCWSMDGGQDWFFDDAPGFNHIGDNGTITGNTATNGYFAWADSSGDLGARTLTTPLVDVSGLTTPAITFYEISDNEGNDNSQLDVEVWDGAAWNLMATYNTNTSGWEQRTINISTLNITGDVQARFIFSEVITPLDFYDDIAIDDVTFDELPSCVNPSNLAVDATAATTATLSWVSNGTETAWEVAIQAPGTGIPTGAGDAATTNPYTATALTPATTYEYYVRADCGGGDFSDWIGPLTFDTECTTFVAPYTEGFENGGVIPLCWTMDGGEDWLFDDDPGFNHIGDNGTITGTTATNNYFAWVDSSGSSAPATLTTPFVDVSGLTTPALSFYEISDNEGNDNSQLDVEVWDGAAWNLMGTYNTNTSGWEEKIINLSTLTITGDVQARFIFSEVITPTDFYDDIAIDDVTFDELPTCANPSNLAVDSTTDTTATLSWVSNGIETAWEVVVQAPGTGTPTGAGDAATTNPYTTTGLTAITDYEYYIRADCGTEFSDWIGPFTFTTECATFTAPYTEGFENAGTIPDCWTMFGGENWEFADNGGFDHIGNNGTITGTTATNGYFAWVDSSGSDAPATLVSPLIDVTALTAPALSFYLLSDNEGNANSQLDVEVWDGAAWNPVATYNTNTNGWEYIIINISTLTITGDIQVQFIFSEVINPTDFYDDIAIDDVTIDELPPCLFPNNITTANITETSVDISWLPGAGETAWEYVVQPVGTGIPTANGTATTSTTVTENGLTAGTTYEIYIRSDCSASGDGFSDWTGPITFSTLPANDECDGAIMFTANADGNCTNFTSGSLYGATQSTQANPCNGTPNDDVWFSFVAVSTDHAINLSNIVGSTTFLSHGVYEGTDCNNLTNISCSTANENIVNGLTVGNTYYIRVFSNGSTPTTTTFDLCVFTVPPPIYVTLSDNVNGDNDDNDDIYSVQGLVEDVLVNSPCSTISNITSSTGTDFGSDNGIGYFEANGSGFPFESGIVMTTGNAANAPGPETGNLSDGDFNWPGDTDLEAEIMEGTTNNASIIEFDFVPFIEDMSFEFIFAAEEYGTFQCGFSDAFAFLLTDTVTGTTTNLAVVPGTTTPVSVFTIRDNTYNASCPSANETLFDAYYGAGGLPPISNPTNFIGRTVPLVAQSTVVPNRTYHIKLVIADDGDTAYDSAVFLKASSFEIGEVDLGEDILLANGNANCEGESVTLDIGVPVGDNATITWYTIDEFMIQEPIINETTGLPEDGLTLEVTETNTYQVEIVLNQNASCFVIDNIIVEFFPSPESPDSLPDVLGCDTDNTGQAFFDITENEASIIGTQTDVSVTYYETQADAEAETNAIANPTAYQSTPPTIIYYRIENDTTGCFKVGTFNLALAPKPVLVQAEDILGCDDDEDGISNYDLTSNEAVIINNQTGFNFSYHTNLADAEASTNAITNPSDFDGGAQTIYVRVEDASSGCFETTTFNLAFGISPVTTFDSAINYEVCPNATVPITVTAIADNYSESEVTITWYNEGVLVSGQTDLTIDNVLTSGTYTIEVMFNETGCTASEDIFVDELESCIIPQGISPNGDQKNDTFDLSSFDVQSLTIFNRNGVKVYEKTN